MSKLLIQLLVCLDEAAAILGIAPKTARNWLSQGRFPTPTVKVGGKRLVRLSDLEAFVAGLVPAPVLGTVNTIDNGKVDQPQIKRGRGRPPKAESFQKVTCGGGQ